jgi:N-acetyl-gamma-glutamylphosphate reductase
MMLDAHLQCSSAFLHASASSQGGFNPSQDGQDRIEKMKPPLYQTRWHRHKNENQTTNQIHWHSLVVIYP